MKFSQLLLVSTLAFSAWAAPSNAPRAADPSFDDIVNIPSLDKLERNKVLDEMVAYFDDHRDVRLAFPGLRSTLYLARQNAISDETFTRGVLTAITAHSVFAAAKAALDPSLKTDLDDFENGESAAKLFKKREFIVPASPAAKQHFKRMEEAGTTEAERRWLNAKRQTTPTIYEDEAKSKVMVAYVATEFHNWGLTVQNTPALTFVPTTVHGLEQVVSWAKANGKRVRAAGYRHTWTNLFSENDEVFVSMLDLKTANTVPDPSSILPNSPSNANNEFKQIEMAPADVPGSGGLKRLVRIGAAVTNEELRRWSIKGDAWTLPMNVVMVEITVGGSNVPICHGGGIQHKTLSDLVRKIEYVDANGKHQEVTDPELLKAAAGAFGLLGVVTHVTMELDKMTYAEMKPLKQDVNLAIPPPSGFTVPSAIAKKYTAAQLETARTEFIRKAENNYYSEWFWFPYQQDAFVNCWDRTDKKLGAIDYPTYPDLFLQWVQGWLGGVINDDPLFRKLPGHWQAVLLGTLAMVAMPPQFGIINKNIKTYLIDGLHFRRGVQNMRVRDIELQIPIPALASDPSKPDWGVVQKAWWDAIAAVYADPTAPMRIALEMRIMADSDMIMAPQKGNTFGTASIEVLTTMPAVAEGVWSPFAQKVADKWMGLKDGSGKRLNTRPHWAKEWDGMTVDGKPWKQYLKEVSYKDEIPQFLGVLEEIGEEQGFTLEDMQNRFSNPLLDDIFFT